MACALLCMPSPQLNVIISTTHRHHTLQVPTSCIASRATSAFHTARLDGQAPPPPPLHATPHFIASTTSPATPPTAIPSTALTPLITSPINSPPLPLGLFDRANRCWNPSALAAAANLHDHQLPELCDACAPESSLPLLPTSPLARHLPPHVRVLPPMSDGAAANLGAGCVDNS